MSVSQEKKDINSMGEETKEKRSISKYLIRIVDRKVLGNT